METSPSEQTVRARRVSARVFPFAFVVLLAGALLGPLLVAQVVRDAGAPHGASSTASVPVAAGPVTVTATHPAKTADLVSMTPRGSTCAGDDCMLRLAVVETYGSPHQVSLSRGTGDQSTLVKGAVTRVGPAQSDYTRDRTALLLLPHERSVIEVSIDRSRFAYGSLDVDGQTWLTVSLA